MKSALWMVQTNLGNRETHDAIKAACDRNSIGFAGVTVVPFSKELPNIAADRPTLAYGATKFIKNVVDSQRWRPGAYFDEKLFTVDEAILHWRPYMVNADCVSLPLSEVRKLEFEDDDDVFVRPNDDLKPFAGDIWKFGALTKWANVIESGDFEFDGTLKIAVSTPKRLMREWRIFAVYGRPVASTQYRLDGRLAPFPGAPESVLGFVEARLAEWLPVTALALDVAEVDGELKIVELSDLHSAGHYAADIESIIVETSRAAARDF